MATTWQPDTCDCVLEYGEDLKLISAKNKCKLHKNVEDALLLESVLTHNRSFNLMEGKTDEEKLSMKAAEKERIKSLKNDDD